MSTVLNAGPAVLLATSDQGDIDLSSPTGELMAQIKTAVSEHEIAMMRVRSAGPPPAGRAGIAKWSTRSAT